MDSLQTLLHKKNHRSGGFGVFIFGNRAIISRVSINLFGGVIIGNTYI
jgi:hypothetical protein